MFTEKAFAMYPEYQKFYLFDYLKESNDVDPAVLHYLKYELDKKIYYFGEHFRYPVEGGPWLTRRMRLALKRCLISTVGIMRKNHPSIDRSILSNAYFSINRELERLGFAVHCPVWGIRNLDHIYPDRHLAGAAFRIERKFTKEDYRTLIEKPFIEEIHRFKELLAGSISRKRMSALCVPNDLSFFHRVSIDVFKEAHLPTFLFLHGLPGRYNDIDDNRTDYLVVWGPRIKELYVKAGVDESKILISGHPFYQRFSQEELQFDLGDVLVLDKPQSGAPITSDAVILSDRGNSIIYLMMVQRVLKGLGVTSVRLRPHPSASSAWYLKFVEGSFFRLDPFPLEQSLRRATLVIGPTSSVLLEAMYYGTNYVLFEPSKEDRDLVNYHLVPPFDGSDARIPLARDEKELESLLKNKIRIDCSAWHDYIQTPFSIDFMKQLV
jgi:hypothetical protein